MIKKKRGSGSLKSPAGSRGRAPIGGLGGRSTPEAETLLLIEHAIFDEYLTKSPIPVLHIYDIF